MDNYVIEKGDTLESIARKYNIPAIEIIEANDLKAPYLLTAGQSITIPTNIYNIFNYYKVKKGDTLYEIANKNNIEVSSLAMINGLDLDEYIYEGQTILIPREDTAIYITKDGDTIADVSLFFKASSPDVLYSNKSIYLLPGQLIVYRKE